MTKLEQFMDVAEHIVLQFPYEHHQDLIQEAYIIYPKMLDTFDESKGFPFTTYIWKPITHQMIQYLRKQRPIHSIDDYIGSDDDDDNQYSDNLVSECDIEEDLITKQTINNYLDRLTDQEKEILDLWVAGAKKRDIKQKLGISNYYIDKVIKPSSQSKKGNVKKPKTSGGKMTTEEFLHKYKEEVELLKDKHIPIMVAYKTGTSLSTINKLKKTLETGKRK